MAEIDEIYELINYASEKNLENEVAQYAFDYYDINEGKMSMLNCIRYALAAWDL